MIRRPFANFTAAPPRIVRIMRSMANSKQIGLLSNSSQFTHIHPCRTYACELDREGRETGGGCELRIIGPATLFRAANSVLMPS